MRFFSAVYVWAVERVEDREQFDARLTEPIPGRSGTASEATREAELAGFSALAGALGR